MLRGWYHGTSRAGRTTDLVMLHDAALLLEKGIGPSSEACFFPAQRWHVTDSCRTASLEHNAHGNLHWLWLSHQQTYWYLNFYWSTVILSASGGQRKWRDWEVIFRNSCLDRLPIKLLRKKKWCCAPLPKHFKLTCNHKMLQYSTCSLWKIYVYITEYHPQWLRSTFILLKDRSQM